MDHVILVDNDDNQVGIMEKIQAHEQGLLHRAFSVFLFDSRGHMLLQQRALDKYHSAGLWSNTCCSHPRPGEGLPQAAARRLFEEMGISCPVTKCFSFVYRAALDNGLTEYEYDHVFTGVFDGVPVVNPQEVRDWRYADPEQVMEEIKTVPYKFSYWFRQAMHLLLQQPSINTYIPEARMRVLPA